MAMSEELKARLAAVKAAKCGRLLKDVAPEELLIACDHAEDAGLCAAPCVTNPRECAYLKYAQGKADALASRLPHQTVRVSAPHTRDGVRSVLVFDRQTLVHVLRFVCVSADKYLRRLDTIAYYYDLPRTADEAT